MNSKVKTLHPRAWGLGVNERGELLVGYCSTVELAKAYGTPLHILNEVELEHRARKFREAVDSVRIDNTENEPEICRNCLRWKI